MGYLPGQFVEVSVSKYHGYGDTCCDCSERDGNDTEPAVTALVGETDSFGSEFFPMCQKHMDEYITQRDLNDAAEEENPTGYCDWCKTAGLVVFPRRDIDEGMSGRVYSVCTLCIQKDNERLQQEFDEDC